MPRRLGGGFVTPDLLGDVVSGGNVAGAAHPPDSNGGEPLSREIILSLRLTGPRWPVGGLSQPVGSVVPELVLYRGHGVLNVVPRSVSRDFDQVNGANSSPLVDLPPDPSPDLGPIGALRATPLLAPNEDTVVHEERVGVVGGGRLGELEKTEERPQLGAVDVELDGPWESPPGLGGDVVLDVLSRLHGVLQRDEAPAGYG